MTDDTAAADADYCAAEARAHDYDRYLCALYAQAAERVDVMALLAFNSELARLRDAVSEPMLGEIRLQWWRETIAGVVDGAPRQHAVARALDQAHRRRPLSRDDLDAMIDARARDLDDVPFEDLDALTDYAAATGGALARMTQARFDAAEALCRRATDVGIAWALTGILRSVAFHGAAGRLLLPAGLLDRDAVILQNVPRGQASPGLCRTIGDVAARARESLSAAAGRKGRWTPLARPVGLTAVLCETYLRRLSRAGMNPFDPALHLGVLRRQGVLLLAAARGRA